jgi:SAM-dependent methyltransferase
MNKIDYQVKVWGTFVPSTSPFSLAGLRFHYFLKSIQGMYGKLLEVGCGAGGNLQAIKRYRPYLDVYGVDLGVQAIASGKQLFPSLHLQVAAAEALPFESASFDIICFFDVLEHVVDPLRCLQEASRVLKPDGVLHAYIPCEAERYSLHGILNWMGINLKEKTAGHIQKLTRQEVEQMCRDADFTITEVIWSCHLLNQIGDILYYWYLTLTNTSLHYSLEGSLDSPTLSSRMLSLIKGMVSFIWYWESRLLWWVPGAGIHITCKKII